MGILGWIFDDNSRNKRIFVSFAIEDIQYRNYLVQQARNEKSPFNFVDMSVKKPWRQSEWQKKCRTKIKGCDGVIALISKNTHKAGGARWEIKCALEEGIPTVGMQVKWNDKGAKPKELKNRKVIRWTWENIENFINSL